eukprot:COSAG02_NODE_834_length_16653_cov_9.111977_6_plen_94_part_00
MHLSSTTSKTRSAQVPRRCWINSSLSNHQPIHFEMFAHRPVVMIPDGSIEESLRNPSFLAIAAEFRASAVSSVLHSGVQTIELNSQSEYEFLV